MLNRIDIMGRLTAAPDYRKTASGTSVVHFTLAVDRDSDREKTDFIRCAAFRSTADFIAKYFAKGSLAVVSGRLQIGEWKAKDGSTRTQAEVAVDNIYFAGAKPASSGSGTFTAPASETETPAAAPAEQEAGYWEALSDEEGLPF